MSDFDQPVDAPQSPIAMRLGVNVDHVATLRQQRGTRYPDPVLAAQLAELAGAHQITVHLREDRRHIQDRDVVVLREVVQTVLNLEMAATDAMVRFAVEVGPDIVTLVPERREERTTEGGLDVSSQESHIKGVVQTLTEAGIQVSLFIDPAPAQIGASLRVGAPVVELHTGDYAEARGPSMEKELARLETSAQLAADRGLIVAAGHGLDYRNVDAIATIPEIEELNIGHSIVARALFVGFDEAVRDMLNHMERARF